MKPVQFEAELLCRLGGQLLEGPSWAAASARVLLVDIDGGERLSIDWPAATVRRVPQPESCSAWIERRDRGTVAVCRSGVRLLDGSGELEEVIALEHDLPANRANDAKCDSRGRLWVGTMNDDEESPTGALYRTVDGEVSSFATGVTISNGLGWSPGGRHMYYIDTPTRRIDVFDYDLESGDACDRRPFADVSRLAGWPDGMAVDCEGRLWVAFYGGSAIHCFSERGEHVASVAVSASRPTSCAFVSSGLDHLLITTAAAPDGSGGDVFVCDVGVRGAPVAPYAG